MKVPINKKNLIISGVLSALVSLGIFLIEKNSLYIGPSYIKFIGNIMIFPLWLFQQPFVYLHHLFPYLQFTGLDFLLFFVFNYPITVFIFWFLVFLLYFKLINYATPKKRIVSIILMMIPIFLVLTIFVPTVFAYFNKENNFTAACLSGEYSKMMGVSDEGAMFCLKNMILTQKLGIIDNNGLITPTEKAYKDTIKFCVDLSDIKLAVTNTNATVGEIVPPNTTYRNYCFIRLADLMALNVLAKIKSEEPGKKYNEIRNDNNSDYNSDYWNIIRKVCGESGRVSGLQKKQECINYFDQYK